MSNGRTTWPTKLTDWHKSLLLGKGEKLGFYPLKIKFPTSPKLSSPNSTPLKKKKLQFIFIFQEKKSSFIDQ